jgi:signal recognition particle receptor subunit beta
MPIVDHATRLITCKLVYYGPGRSGKTTNLTYLHAALPSGQVGSLTSLATRRDRTLFFDYLPVDLGTVGAYQVRFQLYTVPGQPYYKAIRQLVLQGADGVVFVADSQRHRWDDNIESLQDMHANLAEHGVDARALPVVMQYNKQDLPLSLSASVADLSAALNFRAVPEFAADALSGTGVVAPSCVALAPRMGPRPGSAPTPRCGRPPTPGRSSPPRRRAWPRDHAAGSRTAVRHVRRGRLQSAGGVGRTRGR